MKDNIKAVAAAALEGVSNVGGDVTNEDVLKGIILAMLFVCYEVDVERESFFDGLNKAWDLFVVDQETEGEAA